MKAYEIFDIVESQFPLHLCLDFDNSGFLIGNNKIDVNKILVCITLNPKILKNAIEKKVDLIISHHPILFKEIKKITHDQVLEKMICDIIKNKICVYACHTNCDIALGGLNDAICNKLGIILNKNQPIIYENFIGRIGTLEQEMTFSNFTKLVARELDSKIIRKVTSNKENSKNIAVCTGSGAYYINEVKKLGADTYVTSDIKYHDAILAKEIGLNLIDAGHFETEKIFNEIINKLLHDKIKNAKIIIANEIPIFEAVN